ALPFGQRPIVNAISDRAGARIHIVEIVSPVRSQIARFLPTICGMKRIALVVLEGNKIAARVPRTAKHLAELALSHMAVGDAAFAYLRVDAREALPGYEVNDSADCVSSILRSGSVRQNVNVINDI